MSDNSKRPLTRREIREREQAAAAAAQGGAPQGGAPHGGGQPGYPQGGFGGPAPVPPPSRPAPAPTRRTVREPEAGGYPTQAPMVRPPSTTGGVRGLDETGRLTPVQRGLGRDAGARPVAPSSSAPDRTSVRQPFGTREQSAPGSSAPRPFGAPPVSGAGGTGTLPGRPSSVPQGPPPGFPATPSRRESLQASAPPSAPPWNVSTPPPAAVPPSRTGSGVTPGVPGDQPTSPALPWGRTTSEAEAPQAPSRAPGSPFDALVGAEQPVRARAAAPQPVDDDDDDWDDEPDGSYTWLHYIVLVVVAFVLGLLVWKLLLDGPDEAFTPDQASAAVATLSAALPGLLS